jgi:hypothetical protein
MWSYQYEPLNPKLSELDSNFKFFKRLFIEFGQDISMLQIPLWQNICPVWKKFKVFPQNVWIHFHDLCTFALLFLTKNPKNKISKDYLTFSLQSFNLWSFFIFI